MSCHSILADHSSRRQVAPPMSYGELSDSLKPGDILFQSRAGSEVCDQIEFGLATLYTHLGMVGLSANGWRIFHVDEVVSDDPLKEWLQQGKQNWFEHVRPVNMSPTENGCLLEAIAKHQGKPYDCAWSWNHDHVYCSELMWLIFQEACSVELAKPKDFFDELNLAPNRLFWHGYFMGTIPHCLGVSPRDLAASKQLKTVARARLAVLNA